MIDERMKCEAQQLGWRVKRGKIDPWDTSKPFVFYEIIQPDGTLFELTHPDGTPFLELSEEECWQEVIERMLEDSA